MKFGRTLFTLTACFFMTCAAFAQTIRRDSIAPDFSITLSSGETKKLSDYKGKAVLLHFWATWCPPCRAELPEMNALSERLQAQGEEAKLAFLAVCVSDTEKSRSDFMKKNSYTFPGGLDPKGEIASLYGIQGIPASILISADGTVLDIHVGRMTKYMLDSFIEGYEE